MKIRFANKFKNNYSSSISRDMNSIKENKDFETKGEKLTFKNKNQVENNDIFTNENMISNNEISFVYTFRSVNSGDEEILKSENIVEYKESNKDNINFSQNENIFYKLEKNEIEVSDRNTNYQSVIILIYYL